jgi:hypothetical protein
LIDGVGDDTASAFVSFFTIFLTKSLNPELRLLNSRSSGGGMSFDIRFCGIGTLSLLRCLFGVSWILLLREFSLRGLSVGIGMIGTISGGAASSDGLVNGGLDSWMSVAPLDLAEF